MKLDHYVQKCTVADIAHPSRGGDRHSTLCGPFQEPTWAESPQGLCVSLNNMAAEPRRCDRNPAATRSKASSGDAGGSGLVVVVVVGIGSGSTVS